MRNFAPIFIAIAAFSFDGFAQTDEKANAQLLSENLANDDRVVVSYHVEERINMRSGSRITTYEVSNLNQINASDLGPDNERIITPRYGKARPAPKAKQNPVPIQEVKANATPAITADAKSEVKKEAVAVKPVIAVAAVITPAATSTEPPVTAPEIVVPAVIPLASEVSAPKVLESVTVNIVDTYERILDKGYQSVDMLKKVANNRFFDGNLVAAAKWYTKLFALTTELEAEYFYRYSQSLKSINELDKAEEMMAVFEKMNHLR
jgi:hypothetical protein